MARGGGVVCGGVDGGAGRRRELPVEWCNRVRGVATRSPGGIG